VSLSVFALKSSIVIWLASLVPSLFDFPLTYALSYCFQKAIASGSTNDGGYGAAPGPIQKLASLFGSRSSAGGHSSGKTGQGSRQPGADPFSFFAGACCVPFLVKTWRTYVLRLPLFAY